MKTGVDKYLRKTTILQNRTEQNRTEQNRTEQNRTEQNNYAHLKIGVRFVAMI